MPYGYTKRVARQYGICWLKKELSMVHGTLHIFFRNKTFLFVKIESWNFQHLFDLGFRETLQYFSLFRPSHNILLWGLKVVRMSWNFVSFHKMIYQRDFRFQISILTNKKVLFLKKILSVPCTMDSSFFSQQMTPWHPNFPHQKL